MQSKEPIVIDMQVLGNVRNDLMLSIKKTDPEYRSAYANGVLDFYNELKNKLEPTVIKVE